MSWLSGDLVLRYLLVYILYVILVGVVGPTYVTFDMMCNRSNCDSLLLSHSPIIQ